MTAIDWTGWNSTSAGVDFRNDLREDFLQPGLPDWVSLYITWLSKYKLRMVIGYKTI